MWCVSFLMFEQDRVVAINNKYLLLQKAYQCCSLKVLQRIFVYLVGSCLFLPLRRRAELTLHTNASLMRTPSTSFSTCQQGLFLAKVVKVRLNEAFAPVLQKM